MHHVLVRDVRVREDDLVDALVADEPLELVLGDDRDPGGVAVARQLGRVDAAVDVRDLGGGERDDLDVLAAPVEEVEVVKIAPGGADDDDPCGIHEYGVCTYARTVHTGCGEAVGGLAAARGQHLADAVGDRDHLEPRAGDVLEQLVGAS